MRRHISLLCITHLWIYLAFKSVKSIGILRDTQEMSNVIASMVLELLSVLNKTLGNMFSANVGANL